MKTATMKEIAEGRGMPGAILISFVGSSGVMAIPVDDGAIPCRTFKEGCVMHLDAPDDGLIAEMASGLEPIPWRNRQQREDALVHLNEHRPDLKEELRLRLVAHVERTAWYE